MYGFVHFVRLRSSFESENFVPPDPASVCDCSMDSIAQMHCTSSNMLKEVQFEVQAAAVAQVFFLCFFSCEDLLMPTTPTEGGIAWSLEIRSTKQGQKSSTRDQRKSVNMSIGSHSKHSAGHRKRWSFVSRPQFDNSCLAFMNDTNDRTLRPCISWQSREIEMFQGEIVLWANWKHVGSARAIYEQLR